MRLPLMPVISAVSDDLVCFGPVSIAHGKKLCDDLIIFLEDGAKILPFFRTRPSRKWRLLCY